MPLPEKTVPASDYTDEPLSPTVTATPVGTCTPTPTPIIIETTVKTGGEPWILLIVFLLALVTLMVSVRITRKK